LGFSAGRQGHHYAGGPNVGTCFFRTIFCAFAPCPATNGPALPHSKWAHPHLCGLASSWCGAIVAQARLPRASLPRRGAHVLTNSRFRLRHDLSLRAISASQAEQGHLNERGKPFAAKSVAVMPAGRAQQRTDGADSAAGVAPDPHVFAPDLRLRQATVAVKPK
jgi:hypothetical protein